MGFIIIIIFISFLGALVTRKLKQKMNYYSQFASTSGLTGAQFAKAMLEAHGLYDVEVAMGKGKLTDHYNPKNKRIQLSPAIYQGRSVAATAVAAHESGHAIQHAEGYPMLKLRSALVPLMRTAGMLQQFLLIGALLFYKTFPELMMLLMIVFAISTLFSFITLPVEFDASTRALSWIQTSGLVDTDQYHQSKDALKWAALTYVVRALSAFLILIYFAYNYLRPRN